MESYKPARASSANNKKPMTQNAVRKGDPARKNGTVNDIKFTNKPVVHS